MFKRKMSLNFDILEKISAMREINNELKWF